MMLNDIDWDIDQQSFNVALGRLSCDQESNWLCIIFHISKSLYGHCDYNWHGLAA